MSVRVLVVEDEPLVRQRLERMLREILGLGGTVHGARDIDEAEALLRQHAVDVLMLDLSLDGEDGFTLLQRLTARAFHTIVVSAHAERALDAYAHGVLDFVAKPFSRERLAQALARCTGDGGGASSVRHLGVWRADGVALVPVHDVCWIEADGDYTMLRLVSQRRELHEKSLDRLSQLLPPQFARVHRSYVVNLDHAERLVVESGSRYTLIMRGGERIPVGRSRVAALRARWH